MSDIEARRAANRAAFPGVSKIVDEFREAFGDGVRVEGGQEGGKTFGTLHIPSPNCDGCTGHDGKPGCDRMDYVSPGDEQPDPAHVFCGYRLAGQFKSHPMSVYRKSGMGVRK